MLSATLTNPPPLREPQVWINEPTLRLRAAFRGGEEALYLDSAPKVLSRLVADLMPKVAEGRIKHRTAQLGSHKSLTVQILDADTVILTRQVCCQLVQKVASLVGYFAVYAGYLPLRLLSAVRARFLPGEVLLSLPEFP